MVGTHSAAVRYVDDCRNAWKQQGGISRTEAKRRYITTVLDAMHMYASPSPDSRELVTELEFVWDQVKSNVPSASSPAVPSVETGARGLRSYAPLSPTEVRQSQLTQTAEDAPLQLRSPISQSEEADGADEFVDAQDSQYVLTAEVDEDAMPEDAKDASRDAAAPDPKWRQRVEQTLVRMTAEVAALREQLAERRLFTPSRQWTLVGWVWRLFKSSLKHAVVDVVLIGILLLWMRWRQDGRLEGAVRASIGHAALGMQHASSSRLGLSTPVSIAGKAMRSRGQQTRG